MRATIEYIGILGTAIKIWRSVQTDGAVRLKEDGGEESLSKLIDYARESLLWKIETKDILEELLSDSQNVQMRLNVLSNEYKMQSTLDIIDQMLYEPINLPAGNMAFDAMKDLKGAFEELWQEITDVVETAKKYVTPKKTKKEKKVPNFRDIIQYPDKERLIKRLHELIDGKGGADVGSVLLRAKLIDHYLTRNPKRAEYESEFKLIGHWNAIHNYLSDNDLNAIDRANKIVIFD